MSDNSPHNQDSNVDKTRDVRSTRDDAGDRFVHGLLQFLHLDTPLRQEARIKRVMDAIDSESVGVHGHARRVVSRYFRIGSSLAAAAVLIAAVFMLTPVEQSAQAMIQTSIEAGKRIGDRRYEIRLAAPRSPGAPADQGVMRLIAVADIRDSAHTLVRALTPDGREVSIGRNGDSTWAIRPDGTLVSDSARGVMPRWLDLGENTVLVEPMDTQLALLSQNYSLKRRGRETRPGGSVECERITCRRMSQEGPEPQTIELWIDPVTHMVQRMELHWPEFKFDRLSREDGRGEPGHRDGPPDGSRPEGGPPWRRQGRPGDIERGSRPGGQGDGEKPVGGAERRDGKPEDGTRPPPQGRRRPGPHGPPGAEGILDNPKYADFDRRCRGFVDGSPEFQKGHHAPPPRTVIVELASTTQFPDGWFESQTHQDGDSVEGLDDASAAGATN